MMSCIWASRCFYIHDYELSTLFLPMLLLFGAVQLLSRGKSYIFIKKWVNRISVILKQSFYWYFWMCFWISGYSLAIFYLLLHYKCEINILQKGWLSTLHQRFVVKQNFASELSPAKQKFLQKLSDLST